jgi:hypothetical protein
MTTLTANEAGATYRVVRTRRDRRCEDGYATHPHRCQGTIRRGEQYVRAVMFANHDVYAYVDSRTFKPITRPMVTVLCFGCASGYNLTGDLVRAATTIPVRGTEQHTTQEDK